MKKLFGITMLMAATALWGENLVKNGGFDEGEPVYGHMPSGWTQQNVPGARWGFVDDDGFSGATSIQVMAKAQAVVPVMQSITCKPNTAYTLTAALKGDGCLPVVTVLSAAGKQLAQVKAVPQEAKVWKEKSAMFKTSADDTALQVIISADGRDGRANVDAIAVDTAPAAQSAVAAFTTDKENIALHKPYTMSARPQYQYCSDPDDKIQLTDGVYSKGYFWTQKSTVGWRSQNAIEIKIDLGAVQPICGFSYNLAGGKAGVEWPKMIQVYTSDDDKTWRRIGDLFARSCVERGAPKQDDYQVYRAVSLNMPAKGRYVSFLVDQQPYCFVDEIEIYKGDDALLTQELGVKSSAPQTDFATCLIQHAVADDLKTILANAEDARIKDKLAAEAQALQVKMDGIYVEDINKLVTIVPLCEAQSAVFALNSKVLQAKGFSKPTLWQNCRWDNFVPTSVPEPSKLEGLTVEMMRGEVRAEAFNILNPTDKPITVTVSAEGLPAGASIDLREVLITMTKQLQTVYGALKPGNGNSLSLTVPAGISGQVWVSFKRPNLSAGTYQGNLAVSIDGQPSMKLPIKLKTHDFDFPQAPRLHVGGWDYVQGKADYYRAPGNIESNMAMMRSLYVDSPWGTSQVMPQGAKFDQAGHLTNADQLDYTNWITWEERWHGARNWCIFPSVKNAFHGEPMGTPRFETMVAEYYQAFVGFLKTRGIAANRLIVLLVDEPYMKSRDETIIGWARVLHKAVPDVILFEDPIYAKPEDGTPEMYEVSDILCPNTCHLVNNNTKPFFLNYKAKGKTLWLYSCSGPARLLDPVAYHRGQMWHAFEMGAEGTFYWALGCGGGIGDSWHAMKQTGVEYSPYFVSQTDTMDAKQSEGVREGVQDYELLCMLRDRVAQLKAQGRADAKIREAEKLLTEGVADVIKSITITTKGNTLDYIRWSQIRDRTVIDQVRVRALNLLSDLK